MGQEVQLRCSSIAHSLDHMRHAVLARLPGGQTSAIEDGIESFFSNGSSSSSAASLPSLKSAFIGSATPGAVSKEEVGRATWTFLHTLAAQYPERPTRQQKRDAKELIDILTRMYPCGECARHFREVVTAHPPQVASKHDFSLWMCRVHNVVNRSLGKPSFNCDMVASRWAGVGCDEEEACSLDVGAVGSRRGTRPPW